jgi:hypothetical protein
MFEKLLRRLSKPDEVDVVMPRLRYGYGLDKFRDEPGNTLAMEAFLASPLGHKVLSVLHAHIPRGYPLRGEATMEGASMEHMRREGCEQTIALLLAMGRRQDASQQVEIKTTWGVDEDEMDEVAIGNQGQA